MTRRDLTQVQLVREAVELFGDDPRFFAFRCPNCGDVACAQDFIDAGADPDRVGVECIGRSLGAIGPKSDRHDSGRSAAKRGCDWAAYGLFPGPWAVEYETGKFFRSFPLATLAEAEQAGVLTRRDVASDTAEPYIAQVRRMLAAHDLAEQNSRVVTEEDPTP
ncbi:MAG: hypothetical protein HOY78_02115 [Saccharothrix sp.]|nr:hypothetical protein [Saccharothrix sp.]